MDAAGGEEAGSPGRAPRACAALGLLLVLSGLGFLALRGRLAEWVYERTCRQHALKASQQPDEAYWARRAAALDRVLLLDPDCVPARYARGVARRGHGDREGAREDYDRVLALDPRHVEALRSRAAISEPEAALRDLTRAAELAPTNPGVFFSRGQLRRARGELEAALADFDRALQLEPAWSTARYQRGQCRLELGDLDGAFEDLVAFGRRDERFPEEHWPRELADPATAPRRAELLRRVLAELSKVERD